MTEYAHLHCHSIYSIQDAMPKMKDYVDAVYQYNQSQSKYKVTGFAITDHGNISGLVDQYEACNNPDHEERKTKAVYGVEIYHCLDVDNNPDKNRFHLVLLARNNEGLKNIYQIASHGGMHLIKGRKKNFPVTDINFLKTHGKGIIALSACIGGIIPQTILQGGTQEALEYIRLFSSIFDSFYLEIQPLEIPEQLLVNKTLVNISRHAGIPLVITSDSHYIYADEQKYHNILKKISHQFEFSENAHLRTPDEMEEYCRKYDIPLDCISNAGKIAEMCNADPKPEDNRYLLPEYPVPEGYTEDDYLRELSYKFLQEKLVKNNIQDPFKYTIQMVYELDVICNAGYAGYFLILWDWFKWCRDNDILMGPGRGSAAGSIVSYVLNITKVDPIKNGFYFERFLNPGRLSFPDIDSDVPRNRREDAIRYIQNKYGADKVAQIVTFGKYKLKNTAKAILSELGVPYEEANKLTRGIPDLIDGKEVTWELIESVHNSPDDAKYSNFSIQEKKQIESIYDDFARLFSQYPIVYDGIKSICGCINTTGIHAAGVVVCKEPIADHGQIFEPTNKAVLPVLQFQMTDLEWHGFLKIDALGLRNLDIIKLTMDLSGILDYDWYDSEDYSDPKVYEMLRNGDTTDIFQMAGFMATKLIEDFNVHNIEGLTAVNAGNRPGPLEKDPKTNKSLTDLYTERVRTGIIPSIDPRIDPILKNTYGCIWYQESCISLGQVMAGYDAGAADTRIRSTLGKKKIKKIPEIRNEFIYGKASEFNENHEVIGMSDKPSKYCEGAIARGFSEQIAVQIFSLMEAFAKYSFNLAHRTITCGRKIS